MQIGGHLEFGKRPLKSEPLDRLVKFFQFCAYFFIVVNLSINKTMFRLETQKLVFCSARALGLTFDLHDGYPIFILKISKNHILFLTHKETIIDLGSKGFQKKPHYEAPYP